METLITADLAMEWLEEQAKMDRCPEIDRTAEGIELMFVGDGRSYTAPTLIGCIRQAMEIAAASGK
jgi:hypothetical protein